MRTRKVARTQEYDALEIRLRLNDLSTGSCPSKLGEQVRAFSALSPDSSSPEESSPAHPKTDPLPAARYRSSWCNRCSSGAVGSSSEQQGACARDHLWLLEIGRASCRERLSSSC